VITLELRRFSFVRAWSSILAFVLPEPCCVCGLGVYRLCDSCRVALASSPERQDIHGMPLYTTSADPDLLTAVLRAFKDDMRTALARDLARSLSAPLEQALTLFPEVDLVTVVPSSRRAWRKRGFHPVSVILRQLGLGPVATMTPARAWRDQRGLGVSARELNLTAALRARPICAGKKLILVEDVVTSGATVAEAKRAIAAAGGELLCVVALSRIRLRRHADEK
jgi:predicted amidophosphoribosyltransferase